MSDVNNMISLVAQADPLLADKLKVVGDCIVYSGYCNRDGYGRITRGGRVQNAHRYVWTALNGETPADMMVCHRCDNPACCSPAHLFLGTQLDNMRDMNSKGRGRWPGKKGRVGCRGGTNPKAKLTAAQVSWIRDNYSPKYGSPFGSSRLAVMFGVNRNTILYVLKGTSWRAA